MRSATDPGTAQQFFRLSRSAGYVLVRNLWPKVVGPEIARRTEVVALQERTLRVRVADQRWMRVLHRMQRVILGRLAQKLGAVAPNQIGFVEGPLSSPPEDVSVKSSVRLRDAAPPPERVIKAAESIEDAELRRLFIESAARYLGRRRSV
ncbi:MAG: DUF721 domain-containing protein [Vicinamibacteria bacterium]|nr:DUF721 domain-containing protein [Vicinamibacteria bacterium]